jgi:hypothetical protein
MPVRFLRRGLKGPDVKRWQLFLLGKGYTEIGAADGDFGGNTEAATRRFQEATGLEVDGAVGNNTMGKAMTLGFGLMVDTADDAAAPNPLGNNFPPVPDFRPIVGNAGRAAVFGKFAYRHVPVKDNYENIVITDDWERKNIELFDMPQLRGVRGAGAKPRARFHRMAAPQMRALFKAWDDAGLLGRLLSWEGAFVPRFQRGHVGSLSNHAFGSAFDINYTWNQLGHVPARSGQKGSVRELVQIANQHGFYWGGHFKDRPDGMHFEVAKFM